MTPNKTDFMCFPQIPIHVPSFGSLMTLNPEFTTVFRTTTGVIVDYNSDREQNTITEYSEENTDFFLPISTLNSV